MTLFLFSVLGLIILFITTYTCVILAPTCVLVPCACGRTSLRYAADLAIVRY